VNQAAAKRGGKIIKNAGGISVGIQSQAQL
jgi:hypothetical protein